MNCLATTHIQSKLPTSSLRRLCLIIWKVLRDHFLFSCYLVVLLRLFVILVIILRCLLCPFELATFNSEVQNTWLDIIQFSL